MTKKCELKGIAWNHSRALPPLVATAQRYEELYPGVRITWEKRTLHEFGHAKLAQLSEQYDLLVVDHPMMGEAEEHLLDLTLLIQHNDLERLRAAYVGPSFESYQYDGELYALPIDAAAPAASYRPDLLEQLGVETPTEWNGLLKLARRGVVRMPGFPADLFLNWMALCVSTGSPCAIDSERLFDHETALRCLELLRELASWMPASIHNWNPILLYEAMAAGDEFAYCPFAYTYSNYSRHGFAANLLQFANPVSTANGLPMRTVLGGTGLAISRRVAERGVATQDVAAHYSRFVADPGVQRHLYGPAGGQPAASAAWDDALLNQMSGSFFLRTRRSLETAYVRPRYRGYVPLQEEAGIFLQHHLQGKRSAGEALEAIDHLYRKSLKRPVEVHRHA